MLMKKCLLAMLTLMLVILMLILMLLNLNTGYADTDADLCIRIMSLCCTQTFQGLYKKADNFLFQKNAQFITKTHLKCICSLMTACYLN